MKNTLKIVLIVVGCGFLFYGFYHLFWLQNESLESQRQLYGILGVAILFLLGGFSMSKR